MTGTAKYVWAALVAAVLTHLAFVHAAPRVAMGVAISRVGDAGFNAWRLAERVTPLTRTIVRPSQDFAYAACAYDLADGPVIISVAPWESYWSLSLYAANSDNYFVIDDREARYGAEITLVRAGRRHPEGASMVTESPSRRGIALIRRLARDTQAFARAREVAIEDVCATALVSAD